VSKSGMTQAALKAGYSNTGNAIVNGLEVEVPNVSGQPDLK